MSLLEELEARGVTAEDLEKAASVRLFEKAAAAEGVNLDDLDENQVEELYAHFVSNTMSDADNTKEASAMNDEVIDLFEKTAAAEGIDLDEMADHELAELYNHYVENVLPEQVEAFDGEKQASDEEVVFDMFQKTAAAEGLDLNEFNQYELQDLYGHYVENVLPLQLGDEDATDKVASAHEKLAEAEILGRHMARSYADEMDKLAAEEEGRMARARKYVGDKARRGGELLTAKNVRSNVAEVAGEGASRMDKARAYGDILRGKRGNPLMRREAFKSLGMQGGTGLAVAGAGYGAKKLYDKRKGQEKKSSAFDEVEVDALMKIASEFGYDVAEKVAEEETAKKSIMDRVKGGAKSVDEAAQRLGAGMASIGAGPGRGKAGPRRMRGGVGVHRALGYGAPTLAAGGLAYGGKKLMDRRKKNQEKRSSAHDYDDLVNEVALEMLADAGYDV